MGGDAQTQEAPFYARHVTYHGILAIDLKKKIF